MTKTTNGVVSPTSPADYADSCVRYVKEATGFDLDGTQDTLPLVDHYLRQEPVPEGDTLVLVGTVAGAYFGEVVRSHLGWQWGAFEAEEPQIWRLRSPGGDVSFNPAGAALEAVLREPVAGWHGHLATRDTLLTKLEQLLEALGPVEEARFYDLTIRYEVVEELHVALGGAPPQKDG